ncbi:pyruvate ferredoxin oxidoreductase gamma subunit [Megasphaera paucivorans]|uniref:Pyruvate ferredoxin oxidoreductase gamma subunit n=1 Tax=Megasphaera paucivorans TaxID=349095 RepID=A0A1H0B8N4_9FIRM|nr:2-oxoacid:acceptor oxidoreductase family protein [Megasphaera paucivorans]SDN41996.1 pyruvate ferredoxin oxidoreductase gamma subunit [Megasphaera paucivorans]
MKKLKFYGVGGQGIVTAGKIFSIAVSLYEKKYAITIPAYGHERRGAPVYTDVVMDDKPILVNCFVANPDIVVVFDHTIDQKNIDVGKGINDQTILIINTSSSETAKRYKENYGFGDVYYTDATRISMDVIGITIPNATMLGALARTGIMSIESVNKAIIEFFGKKAGEINAKAADISFSQTKKI